MGVWCNQNDCYAEISNITEDSATFTLTFYASSPSSVTRYVELTVGGSTYILSKNTTSTTVEFTKTLYGLNANTTYSWTATLGYDKDGSIELLPTHKFSSSFTTKAIVPTVSQWSWTYSNGSASNEQTQNFYKVLNGQLPANPSYLSYKVWNDLVDKTYKMRSARGYTWDTANGTYYSYAGSKVSSGSTLSAKTYNSVRYNIGAVSSTGIYDVSRGDKITGYHIVRLTEVLNNIISNL